MPLTVDEKLEAIEAWQADPMVHQLTCGNNSLHHPLKGRKTMVDDHEEVELYCTDCHYYQSYIPDHVYLSYLKDNKGIRSINVYKMEQSIRAFLSWYERRHNVEQFPLHIWTSVREFMDEVAEGTAGE